MENKPDFIQDASKIYYNNHELDTDTILVLAMEHVWNTHVVPLQEAQEIISKDLSDSLYDEHLLQDKVKDLRAIVEKRTNEYFDIKSENKSLREEIERLKAEVERFNSNSDRKRDRIVEGFLNDQRDSFPSKNLDV